MKPTASAFLLALTMASSSLFSRQRAFSRASLPRNFRVSHRSGLYRLAHRGRRRGAALVEFALIAVVFLTMLLGMIQFGIYQSTANTLWNLSREGARYASVTKPNPTNVQIADYVKSVAPPNINKSKLSFSVTPDVRGSGQAVTVNLTYDMGDKIIFPLVTYLLGKPKTIPATATEPAKTVTEYIYVTRSSMRVE